MAHATKPDIETVGSDDARYHWPETTEAAKMAGVSKRTLENLVRTGKVNYVYDDSGNRHFDPASLREQAGVVSDADIELDLTKITFDSMRRTNSDLVKANADLLKLATGPAQEFTKLLLERIKAAEIQYNELQEKYLKSIEAFELALTTSHERELQREAARASDSRKDMALKMALDQAPNIIAQLTFKKSIDSLFESLTPEQTSVLFDLLTDKQKAVVMNIMKQRVAASEGPKKGNGVHHSTEEWSDDKEQSS